MCVVMADADEAIIGQLRQVFDLCDEERCGYITSDKLRQLGREHFAGSEQVSLSHSRVAVVVRSGFTFQNFCLSRFVDRFVCVERALPGRPRPDFTARCTARVEVVAMPLRLVSECETSDGVVMS